jgi:hypothetical protein
MLRAALATQHKTTQKRSTNHTNTRACGCGVAPGVNEALGARHPAAHGVRNSGHYRLEQLKRHALRLLRLLLLLLRLLLLRVQEMNRKSAGMRCHQHAEVVAAAAARQHE